MKQEEFKKIENNPLKEIKKRWIDFLKEVKGENMEYIVDQVIFNNGHRVKIKGSTKNYSVEFEIRKRIN